MGEFGELMKAAMEALSEEEAIALSTVVRVKGSAPRHPGAKMLVWKDGRIKGTVGGAMLEQRVIADALAALKEGRSLLKSYLFSAKPQDRDKSVGLCGGEVEVFIDIIKPDPTLLIIGAGHIALPLARMTALLDFRVLIADDRPEYASKERFPEAEEIFLLHYDEKQEKLSEIKAPLGLSTYVVIATWGYDRLALAQVLKKNPAYVALVASRAKVKAIFEILRKEGIPEEKLKAVRAPAGLEIGAETPAEIALSILAEIVSCQKQKNLK